MTLTVFSAFDGAGIGLLSLKRAGIPVEKYYASEVDKYAIQVAKKNHPEIIHVGDVKQCYARNFPKIDLLIGGSPCQDLSIAKANRQGLKGARSSLFWHFVRLLRTMKPRYFLLENVASMSKEDKTKITEIMGVEPIFINSALVSAQQRKRLYWTNIPGITQPKDKGFLLKDVLENGITNNNKSFCIDETYYKGTTFEHYITKKVRQLIAEPVRLGTLAGVGTGQANRIYSVQGKSVCLNAGGGGSGAKTGLYKIDLPDGDYTIRKLTPVECERLQTWPDNYTEGVSNTQRYKIIGNGWTADVIVHIFSFLKEQMASEWFYNRREK